MCQMFQQSEIGKNQEEVSGLSICALTCFARTSPNSDSFWSLVLHKAQDSRLGSKFYKFNFIYIVTENRAVIKVWSEFLCGLQTY